MSVTVAAPITTPFGEFSTADEVAAGIDLDGRRAVVTGASSGIGIETARTLASHGVLVDTRGSTVRMSPGMVTQSEVLDDLSALLPAA